MSVHGTARFATRDDLRQARLLRSRPPGECTEGLMAGWWYHDKYSFEPIEYDGDLHQLIVGGTGGGKFTTAIAPMLLGSSLGDSTVVVVDPKGEIAKLAGPYFQEPFASKQHVHLLDPWDQCGTGQTAVLNILDQITEDNPNYVDDARALADAMIIPSGGENTHWDNAARNFLTAILLYVALSPKEKGNRDLLRVRDLVSMTWAMPKEYTGPKRPTLSAILFDLIESDLANGAVRHGVSGLFNKEDKERSGIISSIDRDTSWMDSPQMTKVLRGKSIDLKEAAAGGHKYFIILPPDFFMTHRAWLRLMVTAFAKSFKRSSANASKASHTRWRHIVIDEFANLGEMHFIVTDIAVARGFDVKYHLAIQDLSQLARVYKQGWESFINNSFQRFFAVSDMFTADYVSRMLGVMTENSVSLTRGSSQSDTISRSSSESTSRSSSSNVSGLGGSRSSGTGTSTSNSASESSGWSNSQSITPTQRSLRTPDEVRRLSQENEFVFFRGTYPIECWRPPYWEVFPSLPAFSLKEILGTIGRKPKSDTERRYFTEWRERPLMMTPVPVPASLPAPARALPSAAATPKQPPNNRLLIVSGMTVVFLLLGLWALKSVLWTSPENPRDVISDLDPSRRIPSARGRPRPAVPNFVAILDMPRSDATRDFILKFVEENINFCAPGHTEQEERLMKHLFYQAWSKSSQKSTSDPQLRERYPRLWDQYSLKSNWSRTDRAEVLDLLLRSSRANLANDGTVLAGMQSAISRFYGRGTCPFDTVAEADYKPPVYADIKLVPQR